MHLKHLELFGFKSFPKRTRLEFPSSITAIVGPNGSGKSNVKEAIQWAFGEHSLKSLRGRRGEDLIWNGSHALPRMGKAVVSLAFDNAFRRAPIAFDEILLERSIFRDGAGEYALNGSPARLRDFTEVAAHLGIGETRHNIIGQGEIDRMLAASPRVRKSMLEDALGLRVHQLKKEEAERKLAATEENSLRVQAILQELRPHAALLRSQAKKAESRARFSEELFVLQKAYLAREKKEIHDARGRIDGEKKPYLARERALKERIAALTKTLFDAEANLAAQEREKAPGGQAADGVGAEKRELEYELSRLEGKIDAAREEMEHPAARPADMEYVKAGIRAFLKKLRDAIESQKKSDLSLLASDAERFLAILEKGTIQQKPDAEFMRQKKLWEERALILREKIQELTRALAQAETRERAAHEAFRAARGRIRDCDVQLRMAQDAERELRFQLERLSFEEERVSLREQSFVQDMQAWGLSADELGGTNSAPGQAQEELKKNIERLRARIESLGAVDPALIKEFQETEARVSFLEKELEDVVRASRSLKEIVRTLTREMDRIFRSGFETMQEEFRNFFRIIFGGGKAELILAHPKSVQTQSGDGANEVPVAAEDEEGAGIDISVNLPRKRIRGLAMLSGGERALASIAFLFAIAAVKPPPFLILDETDAAFDEANSQRYGGILKELAKRTQLILITHNRETMKAADVLYGITMGDDGASRLLSIKFAEAEGYASR